MLKTTLIPVFFGSPCIILGNNILDFVSEKELLVGLLQDQFFIEEFTFINRFHAEIPTTVHVERLTNERGRHQGYVLVAIDQRTNKSRENKLNGEKRKLLGDCNCEIDYYFKKKNFFNNNNPCRMYIFIIIIMGFNDRLVVWYIIDCYVYTFIQYTFIHSIIVKIR